MKNKMFMAFIAVVFLSAPLSAQKLASEKYISAEEHILYTGGKPAEGFYDDTQIRTIYLKFPQSNYWNQLISNYNSKKDLPATMIIDDIVYDSVGVRFKGMTSYQGAGNSQKKSFNISLEYVKEDQKVMGYKTLNLNNSFDDPSFMKEVLYLNLSKNHIPVAKANYVLLNINDQPWGIYPNIQQLNKEYLKEWFISNDGTNWRADAPNSGFGQMGRWGDGTAALNYLGADTAQYQKYYTLKSTNKAKPWYDLVNVCNLLVNTPLDNIESVISDYLDIDRTLWHLATEILFADDDSYVYKGKMDYFVYWEAETGRLTPIEFDGNSCLSNQGANWTPFYNADKVNYPLLNRLLAVPELRQRYLAHFRTLIKENLDTSRVYPIIEKFRNMIDAHVNADPKKLKTYSQFVSSVKSLKTYIQNRKNYLSKNLEIKQQAPIISETAYYCDGEKWKKPDYGHNVVVKTSVVAAEGINAVNLHYASGFIEKFKKITMYDDGTNGDDYAGDGSYAATLPIMPGGAYVRFYIEAISDNSAKSKSFLPEGAEHNVFIYQINPTSQMAEPTHTIIINEIMASNSATAKDEAGEYDDWIELFNPSENSIDISGYYLSDKADNLPKWQIPQGTVINGKDYLIIWADEDQEQGSLHCNFKLSADGEELFLTNTEGTLVDSVSFGTQSTDMSYSRMPNGTGNFVIKAPTFKINNEHTTSVTDESISEDIQFYPNPASDYIKIENLTRMNSDNIEIINMVGERVLAQKLDNSGIVDVSGLPSGVYYVKIGDNVLRLAVVK